MKVVVTGGAGFIGSNLCESLVTQGHQVFIVDNLSTGKLSNIEEFVDQVYFYEACVTNFDFSQLGGVDSFVHLAAQASVPLSISEYKASSSANIIGTINVIDHCSSHNIPLVYASSSAIYGNLPVGDDATLDSDLISPYAADKYAMEIYARAAFSAFGLSSIGLRFFNVYGPKQDPTSPYSGVISIFADRLSKNLPITVNGGHQSRDFIYVGDVVACIESALAEVLNNSVSDSVNVLTGSSITISELVTHLSNIIGNTPEVNIAPLPNGDPEVSEGTIRKMISILNVQPESFVGIEEGLSSTISYIGSS